MSSKEDEVLFNKRFSLKKKISSGSFGVVFQGVDTLNGREVALKLEEIRKDESEIRSVLREASLLQKLEGINGIPQVIWSGTEHSYDVLVLNLLGRDLAALTKGVKRLSLQTVVGIALRLLSTIEQVHQRSIIHRDIKPENILVGREEDSKTIYLVDFGISKYYQDYKQRHIIMKDKKPFIGTTRYASISSHLGRELSRRDDLESLGYVLIFLAKGKLPWQNAVVSEKNKEKYVGKMKEQIELAELCSELPEQFIHFFENVKALEFNQKPDYEKLKSLFQAIADTNNFDPENVEWDWDIKSKEKKEKENVVEKPAKPLVAEQNSSKQPAQNAQFFQKKKSLPVDFNHDVKAFPLKKSQTKENKSSFKLPSNFKKMPSMGAGAAADNFLQVPLKTQDQRQGSSKGSSLLTPSLQSSLIMDYTPSIGELGDEIGEDGKEGELDEFEPKEQRLCVQIAKLEKSKVVV